MGKFYHYIRDFFQIYETSMIGSELLSVTVYNVLIFFFRHNRLSVKPLSDS